jgi:two-component system sensor histidine kinase BaeS
MMRTKLFRSFLIVILAALLAGFIFQWLIVRDFDNYVNGVKEDQIRWIRASLESAYLGGQWDKLALSETIHWAMMLGLDLKIFDSRDREVITSQMVMDTVSVVMKHQMAELYQQTSIKEKYDRQFLYSKNQRIGALLFRQLPKKEIVQKEIVFKNRIQTFLYVSVLIAGVGALLLALIFSRYLSKPLTDLQEAAEKIAGGDFGIRIPQKQSSKPDYAASKKNETKNEDEIAKLSQTFNFMAASLQKEEELRKHLLSNITHELRTPLTIIKTHIEAMADGIVTDQEKGLEVLRNETERLIKLIKGIEDITIAEASFFKQVQKTAINVKEFLSEVVDGMAPVAQERGLFIKIIKKSDLIISTDLEKLESILQNILSNALKFTEKGGLEIDYGKGRGSFWIEIRDSGKGIPEDKIPLIFKRFYQIEPSGSQGFGIGLAIVKELVTTLGGTIEAKSTVGQGTTFKISLPHH